MPIRPITAKTDSAGEQYDPESNKNLIDNKKCMDGEELGIVLNETSLTKDTTCGVGRFKGPLLQKFANPTAYVIVFGLVGCVFAAASSYFNGTISTLEKRFKIPSRNTGIIMIGNDLSQVLWSAILCYYAGRKHRPRWICFGLLTLIVFCLLTITPHFIYGPGEDALSLTKEYATLAHNNISTNVLEEQRQNYLCRTGGTGIGCELREGYLLPQVILFIAQFIGGVGGSLYYTLGVSYMDDNTEKAKAPTFISISCFLGLLGPSLGYSLASFCLSVYIAPNMTPIIDTHDMRWLGAWWMGWLITAVLTLCCTFLMIMFPKELPETAARRKLQDLHKGKLAEQRTSFRDMLQIFKMFLKNRIILYNTSANMFFFWGYIPYWIFTAKYIEIQYRQSAATSSMATGSVAVVFSAIAVLLSGVIISKFQPRARQLAGWNILVDIATMAGVIAYAFIGCSDNDNTLINNSYDSVLNTSLSCNSICHCDYVRYMPICGENDITYISPCHAGCKGEHMDVSGLKSYYDCSCIPSPSNETLHKSPRFEWLTLMDISNPPMNATNLSLGPGGQAISGACHVKCSQQFITFLAVMCICKFFAATGRASNLLITMRSVAPEDKSALMGFGTMLIALMCFVPAPIFYGWIFDNNCLVWGKTCTNQGNCWLYDSTSLRLTLNFVAIFFLGIGTFCDAGVWYHVKDLKVFDDKDAESKEMEEVAGDGGICKNET